ncbi:MAG: hypothetical protein Q8Q09_24960 [Deltaproteobacteria bacterium]|nr:hypothetical protein [Deltaproteobacteria bacterium]
MTTAPKSKPKKSTAKTSARKPAKVTAAPATPEDPDHAEQLRFDRERTALPAPSDALRNGLMRTRSAQRCRELGTNTRAHEVAKEARRTLLGVVPSVTAHGATLRYRPERLRFAMDLVHALELAIEAQQRAVSGSRSVASSRLRADADALDARRALVGALEPIVDADPTEAAAFAAARGNLKSGTDLALSLDALAAQAERWRTHSDGDLRALAEHQDITSALITAATHAAHALRAARDETAFGGGRRDADSAQTNELEGRVLCELDALYDALSRNRPDTSVPLPKLGPATLRGLRKIVSKTTHETPSPAP